MKQVECNKMKQEVDITQIKQATQNEDINVPCVVTEIKQELDSETKHNIQSQFPFLAERIKQELICKKSEEIISNEDLNNTVSTSESYNQVIVKEENVQEPVGRVEDKEGNVQNDVCCCTQGCCSCSSFGINKYDKGHFYSVQPSEPMRNHAFLEKLPKHNRDSVEEAGDVCLLAKVRPDINTSHWRSNKIDDSLKVLNCQMITQNDEILTVRKGDDRKLSQSELCEKSGQQLITDVGIHAGEKPYKCDDCGVGFSENGTLTKHKRIHTGDKPYKCDVCAVGFSQCGNLRRHKRIHTGENTYNCDDCGIGFFDNCNFTAHKKIDTGEKHYTCAVCGVGFSCR